MRWQVIAPGLAALLRYDRANFPPDIVAGLSVAAVALPVGVAYAELAQVPPVIGIYAAIFPLFAYALFGSSRELIVGPDAATCIMAAAAVGALGAVDAEQAVARMTVLSLMAGLIYIAAGLARFGFIANFLSHPILVGYLNGIGLVILVGQLPKLCGFASSAGHEFIPQAIAFVASLDRVHPASFVVGVGALALLMALRRYTPLLPAALIVAAVAIVAAFVFDLGAHGVAVLGSVPGGLPTLRVPPVDADSLPTLLNDAAGLVLIGFAGGILAAKSFARRRGYDVEANRELIAFGICNLASGLAQGFPVTGTDSRTAVNVTMGGRTHLVGLVAGVTMLVFLLFLTAPLAFLPKAALAAIIIVSTFRLFDFRELSQLRKASNRELGFSLATTIGVLLFGPLPGVAFAIALALLWLLNTIARPHDAVLGRPSGVPGLHDVADYPDATTIPGLLLYRFDSPLVFFNCDHLKQRIETLVAEASTPVEWVVIDAGAIGVVDYSAVQTLDALNQALRAQGIVLVFARVRQSLRRFFHAAWVLSRQEKPAVPVYQTVDMAIEAFQRRGERPAAPQALTAAPASADD
jgi:high affinity sulfate transporter 1